ncbi:hypothetical protein DL765_003152 [Monosporascus sp. GIB2]|nr:hypothetical protein DL765_003152 [Monosporascus sp. GIB2]
MTMEAQAKSEELRSLLADKRNGWSADTTVSFPGEADFVNATLRWNHYRAPTYTASISVGTEADVAKAVKFARLNNLPFLATGSRHGYGTTLARLQDGLAIDLSRLNSINVNQSAATVTVGPGVTNEDIAGIANDAGFEVPLGTCSSVSQIGATLGGGVGRWSGVYGLMIDGLLSVRLVTADGDVVETSDTSNPDLFWGIRGAGANLGIIVAATYKLHKPVSGGRVLSVDFMLPVDRKTEYFTIMKQLHDKGLPAELAIVTGILYEPNSGSTLIGGNWAWLGPEVEGREIISPLLEMNPPVADISVMSWTEITKRAGFRADALMCQKGQNRSMYAANMREFPVSLYEKTVDKMAQFFDEHPDGRGSNVLLENWPNSAVRAISDDATAYPWRDSIMYAMFQFSWAEGGSPTEASGNALGKELRKEFAANSGYSDLAVLVNYAHGDETLEQMYGKDKLPRLLGLMDIAARRLKEHMSRVKTSSSVQGIEICEDGVQVRLQDGRMERGSIVIGCDGIHSQTRNILHREAKRDGKVVNEHRQTATFECLFGSATSFPGAPAGIFWESHGPGVASQMASDGSTCRFSIWRRLERPVAKKHIFTENESASFLQEVGEVLMAPGLQAKDLNQYCTWKRLVYQPEGLSEQWYHDRIVLCGESVAQMTSINGMGFNVALQSAALLVNKLYAILRSDTEPSAETLGKVFAEYQETRKTETQAIAQISEQYVRAATWASWPGRIFIDYILPWFYGEIGLARKLGEEISKGRKLDFIYHEDKMGTMPWTK